MEKTGVLLLNLGTPDSPSPEHVGAYLREFLTDPYVIDIPALFRWILVNWLIIPKRKYASGEAYEKVWTERGSPLLYHLIDLADKVRAQLGSSFVVEPGMRYGKPSVETALRKLLDAGATRILVAPLYPQYSLAATESSFVETRRALAALQTGSQNPVQAEFLDPFYDREEFLEPFKKVIQAELEKHPWDMVLFSFHGLPERQVKKTDRSGSHCLQSENCCERITDVNRDCYRAQCYYTAHALARKLGLKREQYEVAFQSRLGRTPWIRPYSDVFYCELPKRGVKKLAVACPAFVSDCLETLEEVAIRGKESFVQNGGNDLFLIPSLNSTDAWAQGVTEMVRNLAVPEK